MAAYQPVPVRDLSLDGEIGEAASPAVPGSIGGRQIEVRTGPPPPAPYTESESGPSFGTPEWEDEQTDSETEDGTRTEGRLLLEDRPVKIPSLRADSPHLRNDGGASRIHNSRLTDEITNSDVTVRAAVQRSREDGLFEAAAVNPPPVSVSSRPPHIDYSYSRRMASPLKRRPSILVQSAPTYGQLSPRVAVAASSGQTDTEARQSRSDGGGAVRQVVATWSCQKLARQFKFSLECCVELKTK